jgi:hypothetical protein
MSDREAFEKWAKGDLDLQHIGVCYGDETTDAAFRAWQAAQAQAGDGEPVGTVYYTGNGFLDVDWFTSDIPDDALLYTRPQSAQVNQQLPEGHTAVKTETLKWLLGEAGVFECPKDEYFNGIQPKFWWRRQLRAAIAAAQEQGK